MEQEGSAGIQSRDSDFPLGASAAAAHKQNKAPDADHHAGSSGHSSQGKPHHRDGLSLFISGAVAAATIAYAIVSSCQLAVMRGTLHEIKRGGTTSGEIAKANTAMAKANADMVSLTSEGIEENRR